MKNNEGYVTFVNRKVNVNDIISEGTIVYPTIEDSLRGTTIEDKKEIALVEILGSFENAESDYYGYYNMKLAKEIKVLQILSYDYIIEVMANNNKSESAKKRFIRSFRIAPKDYKKFDTFESWEAIEAFQEGNLDIYREDIGEKVKRYGKYNNKRGKRK